MLFILPRFRLLQKSCDFRLRLCTAGHQRADEVAQAHRGYSLIHFRDRCCDAHDATGTESIRFSHAVAARGSWRLCLCARGTGVSQLTFRDKNGAVCRCEFVCVLHARERFPNHAPRTLRPCPSTAVYLCYAQRRVRACYLKPGVGHTLMTLRARAGTVLEFARCALRV